MNNVYNQFWEMKKKLAYETKMQEGAIPTKAN